MVAPPQVRFYARQGEARAGAKRRAAPKMMGNTTARPAIRAFITAGAP